MFLGQIIKEQAIDMLVVGTHGRTGFRKLLMGSVAENLFRRADCPVLSIGPNVSGTPEREARFRRVPDGHGFQPRIVICVALRDLHG